jgi:phosphoribosylglycinamide formyltransferase 1
MIAPRVCTNAAPLRLGVLVSGSGTNLQAIIDARSKTGGVYTVSAVVSNVADVRALERARLASVPHVEVVVSKGRERAEFERDVSARLNTADVEVVVLAGFMRVLTSEFLGRWTVVNVHPALCPAFPGMHAAKQALDHGVKITGCTVHLVDAGVDTGPILAQAAVPVLRGDDEETLQKRIQVEEHRLLPEVLAQIARGEL